MCRHIKTFKNKSEEKSKNNKFMSLQIDDNDKLLGKDKTIWINIEDLKKYLNRMLPQFKMIDK